MNVKHRVNDEPFFSIIIPAHNAADRIDMALKSIAAQTYTDYELLVVCDACEDETAKRSRWYTDRVFEEEYYNDGLARNKGLDEARGKWIMFMDDDDWWIHPLVLDSIHSRLIQLQDEIDVLCFSFWWKDKGYTIPFMGENKLWPNVWSKVWKREFIGSDRFPNVKSISDLKFVQKVFSRNPRTACWDNLFYYYNYMRVGSISYLEAQEAKNE